MSRRFNKRKNSSKRKIRFHDKKERNKIKLEEKVTIAKKHVINLSKRKLSDQEYILLAKGLKFIPTPMAKFAKHNLLRDFDEFSRILRCRYFYEQNDTTVHPFRSKSGYQPPFTCHTLENYINLTRLEISSMPVDKNIQPNLTNQEMSALSKLRKDPNIIIKKADKNSNCVIIDKQDYISEVERQLSTQHYCQLESFNICQLKNLISNYIKSIHAQNHIDNTTFKFLMDGYTKNVTRLGRIYILPKIHRIENNAFKTLQNDGYNRIGVQPPGRAIISQCGSATEQIGHFIDYFLVPIVQHQPTYIKDTKSFINIIETLKPRENCLLVSYDIQQMFTNLPQNQLLIAVENAYTTFDKSELKIKAPPVKIIVELLRIILENNIFEFNGKIYKQTIGTAIGAVPSPEICDILMFEILNNILSRFQNRNKIYYHGRYRDDGFIIFDGTKTEIEDFFNIANNYNPLLKFTYDISKEFITFLDTNVFKGQRFKSQGILDLETHFKETNSFLYLHRTSCHPHHVFKGFIKGEAIRHIRNTSNDDRLLSILTNFKIKLLGRGYANEEIDNNITEALSNDRKLLLKHKNKNKKEIPLVLVTKFNPYLRKIKKQIMKYWQNLQFDEDCRLIFQTEPIIAYSKHKNLADILISSKFK